MDDASLKCCEIAGFFSLLLNISSNSSKSISLIKPSILYFYLLKEQSTLLKSFESNSSKDTNNHQTTVDRHNYPIIHFKTK